MKPSGTTSIWESSTVALSSSVHCSVPVSEFVKLFHDDGASTVAPSSGQEIHSTSILIPATGTDSKHTVDNTIHSSASLQKDGGGEDISTCILGRDKEQGTGLVSGNANCTECGPEDYGVEDGLHLAGGTLVIETTSSDTLNQTGNNDDPGNDCDEGPPVVGGTLVLDSGTADHTEIGPYGNSNNEKSPSLVAKVGEELHEMRFQKNDYTIISRKDRICNENGAEGGHSLMTTMDVPPSREDTAACTINNEPDDPEEIISTPLCDLPSHTKSVPSPVIGVLDTPSPLSPPACLYSIVAIPPSQEDVMVMSEQAEKRRACVPGADFVSATPFTIDQDGLARITSSPLMPYYYSSQQSAAFVMDSEVEPSPSLSTTQRRKCISSFDHSKTVVAVAPSNINASTSLRRKAEDHSTIVSGDAVKLSETTLMGKFSIELKTAINTSCTSSTDLDSMLDSDDHRYAQESSTPKTRRFTGCFQPAHTDTNSSATFMYNVPDGLSQTPSKTHQDGMSALKRFSSESVTTTCINEGVVKTASSPPLTNTTISTSSASTWREKENGGGIASSTFPCPATAVLLPSLPASSTPLVDDITPSSSKPRSSLSSQGLFTAASGRKLNVSRDALKKAQAMFGTDPPLLQPPPSSLSHKRVTPTETLIHPSSLPSTSLEKSREGRIVAGPQCNHAINSKRRMLGRRDSSTYVDLRSGRMGEEGDLRYVANGGMNRGGGKHKWQRTGFSTGDGKVLFMSDEVLARVKPTGLGSSAKQVPLSQRRGGTVGNSKTVTSDCSAVRTASLSSHAGKQPSAAVAGPHSITPAFFSSSFALAQPVLPVRLKSLGPPKTHTVASAISQGVSYVVAVLSAATASMLRFSASTGAPCCYDSHSLCNQVFPSILPSCSAHDGQLSTVDTLYNRLLDMRADRKLLTRSWVRNHARWIIWKLACLERSWPKVFSGRLLNLDETIRRLRKRYFLEIERARPKGWPLVRSIMQGDASFSMPMTLSVSRVLPGTPSSISKQQRCEGHGGNTDEGVVVELTDGWHAIRAKLDPTLSHYLRQGRIEAGMKLCVLPTAFEGPLSDPLEVDQELANQGNDVDIPREVPQLKLCYNSTRRARWSAPLAPLKGVSGLPPLCVPLCSVSPLGGLVAAVQVYVLRRYAPQYVDYASGTTSAVRVLSEEEMHGIQSARQDAATVRLEGKEEEIMQKMLSNTTNSALPEGQRENLRRLREDLISHERSSFVRPRPFIAVSLGCPCKACLGGKRLQRSTELHIREPSADVTEQLQPGRLVVLQRVDVPVNANASNGISLHLATARNTTIDFPKTGLIQSFIPSPPVTCAYLGGVAAQFLFWGADDEDTPNVKPPGGDIDFVGALVCAYVLEAAPAGDFTTREHQVFFIDASNQVICLKRHVARDVFTHCRVLSGCRGSCWPVCDVHVMSYDEANSILQASWSDHTDVTCTSRSPSSPAQKQMQYPLRELKKWCNTDSGKGALREAADRIELSLEGTGFILTSFS